MVRPLELRTKTFFPGPPEEYGLDRLDEVLWERMALGLFCMASTGFSVRREIAAMIGDDLGISAPMSGSIWRIFADLKNGGWIEDLLVPLVRSSRMSLVRLTEKGKALCRDMGWEPLIDEWTILERKFGMYDPGYIGLTLEFAYLARQRFWAVDLLPECASAAEVFIRKRSRQYHVHMLGKHYRPEREHWKMLAADDGLVAFVTTLPVRRISLAEDAQKADVAGIACDLQTLLQNHKRGPEKGRKLWLQSWGVEHPELFQERGSLWEGTTLMARQTSDLY